MRGRRAFLIGMAVFHGIFAALFILAPARIAGYVFHGPDDHTTLLIQALGGTLLVFGTMNLLVRNSADHPALRAVLIGTLLFLLLTVTFDLHGLALGQLKPLAWSSIALRCVLAGGYVYHLRKHE